MNEIEACTDNFKWVILDEARAKKLHIQLIKITKDKALLLVDLTYIPPNMYILDYLEWIQETGIVLNLSLKDKQ